MGPETDIRKRRQFIWMLCAAAAYPFLAAFLGVIINQENWAGTFVVSGAIWIIFWVVLIAAFFDED